MSVEMETCPASAPFFGFMGVTSALVFANIGAAYGTAKSGVGISSMGVMNPGLVMRNIIPVVMAGVLGIYGLIVAVIIQGSIVAPTGGLSQYSLYTGFAHLAAGLCCGLSGLAAGMAIGIVGDAGVRGWTAREAFCWYDSDSYFRGGAWTLRSNCGTHSVTELFRVRGQ